MTPDILSVADLKVRYGGIHAVQGLTFGIPHQKIVSMLGRNGAGKSTTLKAIMGVVPPYEGRVSLLGASIARQKPYKIARAGIGYVPETRGIFSSLSVIENLTLAARLPKAMHPFSQIWTLERVYELFPRLAERRHHGGCQLSGGEQQMLSIARALLTNPAVLLLDEPSEGLAPIVIDQLETALYKLKTSGISIFLVEQNLALALNLADTVIILGKGRRQWEGSVAEFKNAGEVRDMWLTL